MPCSNRNSLNNCRRHEKCEKLVKSLHTSVCFTERCENCRVARKNIKDSETKKARRAEETKKNYQDQKKSATKVPSAGSKGMLTFFLNIIDLIYRIYICTAIIYNLFILLS